LLTCSGRFRGGRETFLDGGNGFLTDFRHSRVGNGAKNAGNGHLRTGNGIPTHYGGLYPTVNAIDPTDSGISPARGVISLVA